MVVKVVKIDGLGIYFDNGYSLQDYHDSECCENHYLGFDSLDLSEFDGLEFDLSGDNFFKKIEDFGIELVPIKGWGVKIAGYSDNNGWYSSDLSISVFDDNGNEIKEYDISECQTDIFEI